MGETGLNGDFSGDFFFVPVGGVVPFRNFFPTRSHARVKSNDDTSCVLQVPPWPTMPTCECPG